MPKLFGRNFTRRQLLSRVGDISQLMYARRAERREGFERGADLIDVFNASGLGFSVLPGRALDIASAHYKGQSLCFRSGPGRRRAGFLRARGLQMGARLVRRAGHLVRPRLCRPPRSRSRRGKRRDAATRSPLVHPSEERRH